MISNEVQIAFDVLIALVGGLGGWILNSLRDDLQKQSKLYETLGTKVQAIEVIVAGEYIKRDEFENYLTKFSERMDKRLDRIEDKLSK